MVRMPFYPMNLSANLNWSVVYVICTNILSSICLILKEDCRLASKVSLGKPSRREGSLEASHTSAILIYYFALLFVIHPSHFQLAYIVLDRSIISQIYILSCGKSLSQKGKVFLNFVWLYVAILARRPCCFNRYIRSDRRLLAAPKGHIQHSTTPWGNLVAISYSLVLF